MIMQIKDHIAPYLKKFSDDKKSTIFYYQIKYVPNRCVDNLI